MFVSWGTNRVHHISLNHHVAQGRIIVLLAGVEFERRAFLTPDPCRIAMTEVGDDVVGDDGTPVGIFRMGRRARHEADGPQAVPVKLIAGDDHISRAMHGLHSHEGIRHDVVRHDDMIAMQIDTLRGILDVVAQNTRQVRGFG